MGGCCDCSCRCNRFVVSLARRVGGPKDSRDWQIDNFLRPQEVEGYVRNHIVEIAEEQFPDNRGLKWIVYGFQHREDLGLVFAEVEPRPDVVGYPRFQFAFLTPRTAPPKHVAAYCLEFGKYTLLSKSRDAPRNLPKQLG